MQRIVIWTVLAAFSLGFIGAAPAFAAKGKKKKATPEESFKKLDKNGDGKLSKAEFVGKSKSKSASKGKKGNASAKKGKKFAKLDKNNDGFLSLNEFKAQFKHKSKSKKKK